MVARLTSIVSRYQKAAGSSPAVVMTLFLSPFLLLTQIVMQPRFSLDAVRQRPYALFIWLKLTGT